VVKHRHYQPISKVKMCILSTKKWILKIKRTYVPIQYIVNGGAHDVVNALQVVVQLLHVVRRVRIQIISSFALDNPIYYYPNDRKQ